MRVETEPETLLDHALVLARRGYAVLPLVPGAKNPLTSHGVHDATTDEATIREWWRRTPNANIGIRCGSEVAPGRYLAAIDIDSSVPLPFSPVVKTPRGSHYYYFTPEPMAILPLGNVAGVRGLNSYVVAPPSVVDGKAYSWAHEIPDTSRTANEEWVRFTAFVLAGCAWLSESSGLPVREGERNVRLTQVAGFLHGRGVDPDSLPDVLETISQNTCREQLPAEEIRRIAQSIGSRPKSVNETLNPGTEEIEFVWLDQVTHKPTTWLLGRWIPDKPHVAILYGAEGTGKSFMALSLAFHIVTGRPFCGLEVTQKPVVFYVDYELSAESHHERAEVLLDTMGLDFPPGALAYTRQRTPLLPTLPALIRRAHSVGAGAVVIDSIGMGAGGDLLSQDFSTQLYMGLEEFGVPVIVIHHQAKSQFGESSQSKTPYGSVYQSAIARSVIHLWGERDGYATMHHHKATFGAKQPDLRIRIERDGEQIVGFSGRNEKLEHALNVLRLRDETTATATEIAELSGLTTTMVGTLMGQHGYVQRRTHGGLRHWTLYRQLESATEAR